MRRHVRCLSRRLRAFQCRWRKGADGVVRSTDDGDACLTFLPSSSPSFTLVSPLWYKKNKHFFPLFQTYYLLLVVLFYFLLCMTCIYLRNVLTKGTFSQTNGPSLPRPAAPVRTSPCVEHLTRYASRCRRAVTLQTTWWKNLTRKPMKSFFTWRSFPTAINRPLCRDEKSREVTSNVLEWIPIKSPRYAFCFYDDFIG